MTNSYEQIDAARVYIAERTGRDHSVALTLGSGLSSYAETLPDAITIPYSDIPHFPRPTVEGHGGMLVSASLGDGNALVYAGRVHFYEGRPLSDLVFGVRVAALSGCTTIILTNAAGGCGDGLAPGDLVVLKDHLNLTGQNPLHGANDDRLGPRFPDMSTVYPAALRQRAHAAARATGSELADGVYAWFTGPSYETPAEVEMARRMGADLVGMSTVPEAIAACHMGAGVIGISLVTNYAAGIIDQPLSHEEVTETAAIAHDRFTAMINELLKDLVAMPSESR